MLYTDFTQELLNIQGLIVKKVEADEEKVIVCGELEQKPHKCPRCGSMTDKIHDYRTQTIKHIPSCGRYVYLKIKKRRYICQSCNKRFAENNTFLPRYYRMTNAVSLYVIDKLRNEYSFTSVAKDVNLSVSTVIRIFDIVNYPKPKLPNVLSIDEFKGNTGFDKYQCIVTDPINRIVLDILPNRNNYELTRYFKDISKEQRENVNFFVSDMWRVYQDISYCWLKNATRIVDKYHWIRLVIWAFEAVRKQEQAKFSKKYRIYFKRSKSLLTKRFNYLSDERKQQVLVMLSVSATLSSAHFYKEKFFEFLDCDDPSKAKCILSDWINSARGCDIPQFVACANSLDNWRQGILNSIDTGITNGFTEGCNNKIKVLKRNAYGYRNFKRFRNRILHMFSHQLSRTKKQPVA